MDTQRVFQKTRHSQSLIKEEMHETDSNYGDRTTEKKEDQSSGKTKREQRSNFISTDLHYNDQTGMNSGLPNMPESVKNTAAMGHANNSSHSKSNSKLAQYVQQINSHHNSGSSRNYDSGNNGMSRSYSLKAIGTGVGGGENSNANSSGHH